MQKLFTVFALCITLAVASQAQSLERQVIGSAGGFDSGAGVSLSYTVGEPIVETAIAGTVILTQGFQQPDDVRTGIKEVQVSVDYTVYPNPTDDNLFVQLKSDKEVDVMLVMYDMAGKRIENLTRKVNVNGTVKEQMSLKGLAAATYLLELTDLQGNTLKNFKIQKIN